jgi:hypothetical protein
VGVSQLAVGAQFVVSINGHSFGRVADIDLTSQTPRRAITAVDLLTPVELVPLPASAGGTVRMFRLQVDGGAEVAGMVADWNNLTREKYWSMTIVSRVTGRVVFRIDRCATEAQRWSVGKGYVMGTIQFSSLDLQRGG